MTDTPNNNSIDAQRKLLHAAFLRILGTGIPGTITFVRCFDSDFVRELIADPDFTFDDWDVRAVGDENTGRAVTADQAVEIREDKNSATLFLVDQEAAGAGMDGIYSASREITEKMLLKEAIRLVRKEFSPTANKFSALAVKRSKRVGERNSVSLWREFEFYAAALSAPSYLPRFIGRLGLWPIDSMVEDCSAEQLDISARMVERLLLEREFRSTPSARVKSLMLADTSEEQEYELQKFIARGVNIPSEEALLELETNSPLMIGNLTPRFSSQSLIGIELKSWRTNSGRVAKWSGLTDAGEAIPVFSVNPDATATSQYSRLEVRWDTRPEEIVPGSVEYRVTIHAGDVELASRTVSQTKRSPQVVRFTNEDIEDLDQDSKFEVCARVVAIGSDTVEAATTEEFLLQFGTAPELATAGSGRRVRTLVEGLISAKERESFVESCDDASTVVEDRQGFMTFRPKAFSGTSSRAHRPSFVGLIEKMWLASSGAVGRWTVRVRSDGTRVGDPQFVETLGGSGSGIERLRKASANFCREIGEWKSTIGRVYCGKSKATDEYVSAWTALLELGEREACLANTVEVQSMSGDVVGLIVLPMHTIRVVWQMAYDNLALYARYSEGLAAARVQEALKNLDSSHFPFALPGLDSKSSFIFGDTLGFHCVAMVSDKDREPKAAIAQMATCLGGGQATITPTVGTQMSDVISKELRRYLEFHPPDVGRSNLLHVNALKPGDGATISKALQKTLITEQTNDGDDEAAVDLCYVAELFPADRNSEVTGTYLSDVVERNRAGASGVAESDKWMVESVTRPGGVSIPRLRWARRDYSVPKSAAHVSIVFDAFAAEITCLPISSLQEKAPLHAFGLAANIQREFTHTPTPTWLSHVAPKSEGSKHPAGKIFTDRLLKIQNAILKAVARNSGYDENHWPVLRTEMTEEDREALVILHKQSDWVITIDRNAGIEFFDSPLGSHEAYDAYVIDCVPERNDLAGLQLITSTTQSDEIRDLLDHTLGLMGLSTSLRNCQFLLSHLKALSGRLAIRLSSQNTSSGELVALSLLNAACQKSELQSNTWLPLRRGFFVPLDDVLDLVPIAKINDEDSTGLRADLLFVGLPARGSMYFTFVEVKYRRHLRMARDPKLVEKVQDQIRANATRWQKYFFDSNSDVVGAIRRSNLAGVLSFYADKAARHYLDAATHSKLLSEIDKLIVKGNDYQLSDSPEIGRGFIFCPELMAQDPVLEPTTEGTETPVYLFGPASLPDIASEQPQAAAVNSAAVGPSTVAAASIASNHETLSEPKSIDLHQAQESAPISPSSCSIHLGNQQSDGAEVNWELSIASNPHLMLVGLPGMGKTTTLLGICDQLIQQGVVPIVFSYHEDIDERMLTAFDDTQIFDPTDLGFNPMLVRSDSSLAYIDNAGQLRDIFAAMYPDLGDIQLDKIRRALKESYTTNGWGKNTEGIERKTPAFRDFYLALTNEKKPDGGLLARLGELDDYGVFGGQGEIRSLLDVTKPTILRIHATQNENVQRAFAMIALYGIYKEMFQRGVQEKITHVIVFDEAHRASKMKLLPTMAKESRKFGISLLVSSQEAKDFDVSLFSAIANYALLRMTEADARRLAKNITTSDNEKRAVDRLKTLPKYEALFYSEGRPRAAHVELNPFEK